MIIEPGKLKSSDIEHIVNAIFEQFDVVLFDIVASGLVLDFLAIFTIKLSNLKERG